MGLYQEVRPTLLEEIGGNENTIKALGKMLESARKPHAILLHGPSGCGKTTIGRILAKEFGSTDDSIFEMNAANTRGIDDIREIAKTANLSTLGGGKCKTYIIDESHQLTPAAQEAFLKILEECKEPNDPYFILCTTEPENLIKTVRNRCTDYNITKLSSLDILKVLQRGIEKAKEIGYWEEDTNILPDIVEAVAAMSDGSPRAALVALEKVKDIEDLDTAILLLLRGTEHDPQIKQLCIMLNCESEIRKRKASTILNTFDMIDEPPEKVRRSILTYFYKMAVTASNDEELIDLAHLISIFAQSVYYGNKAQLGALIIRAIFQKNPYKLSKVS